MKIKQLKEKTPQGLKDFLPKIGVGDIEGLLDALNDKLSKSQGGEINKPIVITNDNSDYSLTINPDSIYIWSKKNKRNILSIRIGDRNKNIIDLNVLDASSINIGNILNLIANVGEHNSNIYSAYDDTFTASKFKLRVGNNNQVLLGDGSTTSKLVSYISTSPQFSAYIVNILNIDGAHDSFTIPGATKELAGLMTATDKVKLDDVPNKYAEKSEALKTIKIKQAGEDENDFDEGVIIFMNYANSATAGKMVVIDNATATKDGCMSHEDKKTLDAVKTTYLPLSGGKMTGTLDIDFENGIRIVENDNDARNTYINNGSIRIESLDGDTTRVKSKTEIDSNSITTPNAIITNEVKANGFSANNNGNGNTVWTTNGGSIDLINLLKNAAIYVAGEIGLAEGGLDNTTVINAPDIIIFDQYRKRFLARKSLTYYTHWNANIARNIAPPSRYGIETNIGVYPFNNQLYKFSELDGLYTATCFNGGCNMTKLTINKE